MDLNIREFTNFSFEGNIVIGRFEDGKTIDLLTAKKIVEDRLELFEGKSYPILIDCLGMKSIKFTKEARDYFAKEGTKGITAGAFLVDTFLLQVIVNIFITFNCSTVPLQVFKSKAKAIQWLSNHLG